MANTVYYVPYGTKNLKALFPSIPWDEVEEYFIEMTNEGGAEVLATSPVQQIAGCEDDWRIRFLNYLGTIDALNFHKTDVDHESKSSRYEKGITVPFQRSAHATGRLGVRSNDVMKGTIMVEESAVEYLDEILDSPLAWLEWPGIEGEPADFLPIVIIDKKSSKFKQDDRFMYEIIIEFTWSHDRVTIRN